MTKKTSTTMLTIHLMEQRGFVCEKTEHHARFGGRTNDLFGFIDVLCLGNSEVVGVQTTSYSNVAARVKKIADHDNVAAVRRAGIRILVQGWYQKGGVWQCREVDCS